MSRAGLSDASTQPVGEVAQAQRTEPVRVTHADDAALVHHDEGERALQAGQHLGQRPLEVPLVAAVLAAARRELRGQQLSDHVGVAAHGAGQHAGLVGEGLGVGEVAVVAEGEAGGCRRSGTRAGRCARSTSPWWSTGSGRWRGGRRARPACGRRTRRRRGPVLHDGDGGAVAHCHARRLLAAVLQGEQSLVGQVGDRLPRGVDAEDATRLLRLVVERHTGGHVASLPGRGRQSARH